MKAALGLIMNRMASAMSSGMLAEARSVGMVLGVGIAGAIYTTVLRHQGLDAVGPAAAYALRAVAVLTAIAVVTSWREGELKGERNPQVALAE